MDIINTSPTEDDFVYFTEIKGNIDGGTSHHLNNAINKAETDEVPLIIKLNTPGGLLSPTKDIVDRILESEVKIIVWVHPKGAWAYSAGTYILISSDFAVMDDGTSIGAAEPRPPDNKTLEAMIQWIGEIAETTDRPSEIAREFVSKNRTMGPREALDFNVIDLRANNISDILYSIGTPDANTREISEGLLSQLLSILSHPQIAIILFIIGLLGIATEVTTPGIELPGVIGVICLLFSLWGLYVIEIWPLGLLLLLLGVILICIEILEPGFGIFGVGGFISLLSGLWIIGDKIGGGEPWIEIVSKTMIWGILILISLLTVIIFVIRKSLKKPVKTGMEAIIGEIGRAKTGISTDGVAHVRGESWKATSIGEIRKGELIIVEDVVKRDGQTTLLLKKFKED